MNAPHSKDIVVCLFLRWVASSWWESAMPSDKTKVKRLNNTTRRYRGDPKERKQSPENRTPPTSNKTKVNNNSLIGKLQKQLHSDAKKITFAILTTSPSLPYKGKKQERKKKKLNELFQSKRDRKQRKDSQKSQRIVLRKSLPFGHVLPERKEMWKSLSFILRLFSIDTDVISFLLSDIPVIQRKRWGNKILCKHIKTIRNNSLKNFSFDTAARSLFGRQ